MDDGRIKVEIMKAGAPGGAPLLTILGTINGDELVLDLGGGSKNKFVRDGSNRAEEIQAQVKKAAAEREKKLAAERRAREEIRKAKLAWLEQQRKAEQEERKKRWAAEKEAYEKRRAAEQAAYEKRRAAERAEREKQRQAKIAYEAGRVALKHGIYTKAVAESKKSWELGNLDALNYLAWHYDTCKDRSQLNGKLAVELALKLTELKPKGNHYDTLAAAYARNGQFQEAVNTQIKALSMSGSYAGRERLMMYQKGKAYQVK